MNKIIESATEPSATTKLIETYHRQSEAIVKHAELRRRPLSDDDLKQLKGLAIIIKGLGKVDKPEENRHRVIVIGPKDRDF